MKKQFIFIGAAVILGFVACNDTATTTTTSNPNDSTVQTTTTTTTTKSYHPINNFEHRTFYSVVTGKPVKLQVDTVNHYYVDMTTKQQPDYYYFDPATHDTFDYWGRVLNNALIMNNGTYSVDESRLMPESNATMTVDTATKMQDKKMDNGNLKIKQKDDMYKEKTDSTKVKIKTK